jgi:hypothetical protein
MEHYILVNGKMKKVSLIEFAIWFENIDNRRIDYTTISDDVFVSTVFLGIDMNFMPKEEWKENPPILFETMVMGGKFSDRGWRYSTLSQAKRGHWEIVDRIRMDLPPNASSGERPPLEEFFEMFEEMKKEETEEVEKDSEETPNQE